MSFQSLSLLVSWNILLTECVLPPEAAVWGSSRAALQPGPLPQGELRERQQWEWQRRWCWADVIQPVFCQASQLIVNYDEHEVNNTFKFGVIFQRFGQVPTDWKYIWFFQLTVCPGFTASLLVQDHHHYDVWLWLDLKSNNILFE